MGITALKKSFVSVLVSDLASKDTPEPSIGKHIFVFKGSFVGTLSLCLKMLDSKQNIRIQSDHLGPRKCPKTAEKLTIWISAKDFMDVI